MLPDAGADVKAREQPVPLGVLLKTARRAELGPIGCTAAELAAYNEATLRCRTGATLCLGLPPDSCSAFDLDTPSFDTFEGQ